MQQDCGSHTEYGGAFIEWLYETAGIQIPAVYDRKVRIR